MHFFPKISVITVVYNGAAVLESTIKSVLSQSYQNIEYILIDERMIIDLKKLKTKLIPWTVNETAEMIRLINMGVDGIITDYPNRAVKVISELFT